MLGLFHIVHSIHALQIRVINATIMDIESSRLDMHVARGCCSGLDLIWVILSAM